MFKDKFIIIILLLFTIAKAQEQNFLNEPEKYLNKKPIKHSDYNADEELYIDAATYFYENKSNLSSGNQTAVSTFEQIKTLFLKIENQYPDSKLTDDAQLAIAEAARYLDDKNLYESELQKVISDYPHQHITYLNFEHPICNSILPALQSSFVQTDAYAKLQLAMIYFSSNIITSTLDYSIAITKFDEVIQNFPFSYCSALAQYNKASSYEILAGSSDIDKNIVIDEYAKVFDLYKEYSLKYSELALVKIGDFAIKFLPNRLSEFKSKMENFYSIDDYIAESRFLTNRNAKWNKSGLTIYFSRSDSMISNEDSVVINDVIEKLNNYFSPNLDISLTSNIINADITIEFSEQKGNFTQLSTKNNSEFVNEITSANILVKDNSDILKRKEILLHELGHALGLGHSFNSEDNLYFSGNKKFEFSERDKNTINKLYALENSAPIFLTKPYTPRISPGEKIFFDIDSQDFDFENPSYSIINKPNWLNIDSDGIITGLPSSSETGYHEYVIQIKDSQNSTAQILWKFMVDSNPDVTSVEEKETYSSNENKLYSNYPNPFNPVTNLRFELKKESNVKVKVFNILGQLIIEKPIQLLNSGFNSIPLDLRDNASGLYIYKISIDDELILTGKLMLVK